MNNGLMEAAPWSSSKVQIRLNIYLENADTCLLENIFY